MNLESFLNSLGAENKEGSGVFTLAADRARKLLSEKALHDPWQSWLCLFQGFHRLEAQHLSVQVDKNQVSILVKSEPSASKPLQEMLRDERFLLGWLNLDWFGEPAWDPEANTFVLKWSGAVWKRYRTAAALRSQLRSALCYSPLEFSLEGSPLPLRDTPTFDQTIFLAGNKTHLGIDKTPRTGGHQKVVSLHPEEAPLAEPSGELAAVAYRSGTSWSHARWVHHGVIIKEERNTLERPGLLVIAAVEGLGLNTDLAGFELVHDEKYYQFITRLKKEVLWML
ncbi:MAG: hypothetical protein KC800_02415 [Candidatus Eremiobacteraeota bacterium]|nr:hypothetical protein [Candidatus Eremiobacteraeota bacterium]